MCLAYNWQLYMIASLVAYQKLHCLEAEDIFHSVLFSTYYMPGNIQGSEDPAANSVDIVDPHEVLLIFLIKISHDPKSLSNGKWVLA